MIGKMAQLLVLALITSAFGCSKDKVNGPAMPSSSAATSSAQPNPAQNESAAAGAVRTLNTAEVVYATTYPSAGYAGTLPVLGSGTAGGNCSDATKVDPSHACLVEGALACASASCVKSGYQFSIISSSKASPTPDYTITATPTSAANGRKNFCSTSDAVIRVQVGPPLNQPVTQQECSSWSPL
jgi:hypothetical protein